jgi:hypothetical protein
VLPGRHKRGLTRAHCCAQGQIVRLAGLGQAGDLFSALDREALASIGVDLDAVRARIKAPRHLPEEAACGAEEPAGPAAPPAPRQA